MEEQQLKSNYSSTSIQNQETITEGKNKTLNKCHICEETFSRPLNCKTHIRTVHGGEKNVCPLCDASFVQLKKTHSISSWWRKTVDTKIKSVPTL